MRVISSRVAQVTVYASGAVVTRRLQVAAEDTAVRIEGLPLELVDDSIRVVSVDGQRAVEQAVVSFGVAAAETSTEPPLEEALAELRLTKALADQRRETLRALAAQLSELELRRRLGPEEGVPAAKSPTRARLQWLGLQAQQQRRVQDDLADAHEECRLAADRLAEAQAKAAAASSDRQARPDEARKRVEIALAPGGAAEVEVSYRVRSCRWAPSYVLRIQGQEAVLEMRAFVAQATGEDWSGAAISVSTASVQQWVELPEVRALKIGRRQDAALRTGWRAAPEHTDALYRDFDRAARRDPVPPPPTPLESIPPPQPVRRMRAEGALGGSDAPPVPRRPAPAASTGARRKTARAQDTGVFRKAAPRSSDVLDDAAPEVAAFAGAVLADVGSDGRADAEDADRPTPELTISRQLMDYGALRMQGPEHARRGTLQREPSPPSPAAVRLASAPGHAWVSGPSEFDHTYEAQGEHEVPSDGAAHMVAVLELVPELSRRYVCVPGQSSDVFRLESARNPSDSPLPAGSLDVYQDGQFSLTTPLAVVAPGGRFELGLGVEQGIKVARRLRFEEDTEGLLKRQHAFEHQVDVEVQNLLEHAVSLEIRERIPVAARRDDPDIEVVERRVEPLWDPFEPPGEELKGGRRWRLTVPPAERMTLTARWVVRVPRGRELVGGNRRAR